MKKIINHVFDSCYQGENRSFKDRKIAVVLILFLYGASITAISTLV